MPQNEPVMALLVKTVLSLTDNIRLTPEIHRQEERSDSYKLSSSFHKHNMNKLSKGETYTIE